MVKKEGMEEEYSKYKISSNKIMCDINNDGKDEIVFGTRNGMVYVLNNESKLLWNYKIPNAKLISKVVAEDIDNDKRKEIVFGTENGNVHCLSYDGKIKWNFETNGAVRHSIAIVDSDNNKKIVIGSMDKQMYLLDGFGSKILSFHAQDGIESEILVHGEQIIFGCKDKYIYSVNHSGHLNWKYNINSSLIKKPKVSTFNKKNYIVLQSKDNQLHTLNTNGSAVSNMKARIIRMLN